MGTSKLFGSGSSAPLNSIKVEEYAYQNLPANIFVKKVGGSSTKNNIEVSYVGSSAYSGYVWLNEFLVLIFRMDTITDSRATSGRIRSIDLVCYKDTGDYQTHLQSAVTTYSRYTSLCIQKNQKRIIATYSSNSNAAPGYASKYTFYTYRYTDVGVWTDELTAVSVAAESLGYSSLNVVSGEYDSNFVYAMAQDASGNTALLKLTTTASGITSTKIADISTKLDGELSYIKDVGMIVSNLTAATYKISTATTYTVNSYCLYFSWFRMCAGLAFLRIEDNADAYYYSLASASYSYFDKIKLTGAERVQLNFTITINGSPRSNYQPLGIIRDPIESTKRICLLGTTGTSGVYLGVSTDGINYSNLETSNVGLSQLSSSAHGCLPAVRNGEYVWSFSALQGKIGFVQHTKTQIKPTEKGTDVIYGITAQTIKPNNKGKVYVPNTSVAAATYTTYGITEALATQIVDDSVDKIKQEVQNADE